MIKPNFFLVGAPKCGTSAMNDYLGQHPDVFMALKEIHFFGSDLNMKVIPAEEEYLNYFDDAENKKIVGEASVWYLFSKTAAQEIKKFSPGGKILIMLRNPVDVVYSLHSQHLYNANEDIRDFRTAVSLDEERKTGINLPDSVDFIKLPSYKEAVMYSEQVKRYIDVFGRENVHIILYDDFVKDTPAVVANTFKFLEVDPNADITYKVVNPNKEIRHLSLNKFLKRPPLFAKSIARLIIPSKKIRHQIMATLSGFNTNVSKRKKMDEQLKSELRLFFQEDVKKLSEIINRDLSMWE